LVFILRADNHGEGGILALATLITPHGKGAAKRGLVIVLGLFGAAFLYADGMITLGLASASFQYRALRELTQASITPFWSDGYANPNTVTFGRDTVNGRNAFAATWNGIIPFPFTANGPRNVFQLVLIDRADTGAGNFDFEFNYNSITWECSNNNRTCANGVGFAQARAETGAQQGASCHREHSAVRVTAPSTGYCVSCHQDMKVKDDKTSPTHDYLVRNKQWTACLQCHDYHGNHKWNAPLRLQDAATLEALDKYLQGGPSPFGATIIKAKQGRPG